MAEFTTFEASSLSQNEAYRLMTGGIAPRPIAWVTTLNNDGFVNAAPFSSFNYMGHTPPALAVSIATRNGVLKDTAANILDTREFVVNMPNVDTLDLMHATSAEYPAEISETALHNIDLLKSTIVKPPRIASTLVQFECKLDNAIAFGPGVHTLFLGEVVAIHVSNSIFDGRYLDIAGMKPVMRIGGPFYATLGEILRREPVFSVAPTDDLNNEVRK